MRTIKFRGYSTTFKENEFFYGDLVQYHKDEIYIVEQNYRNWDILYSGIRVEPNSIGQFTGLYDKNGNEIYENDILQVKIDGKEYNPLLVVYSEVYAGFCMLSENTLNNVIYKPHRPINPNWWDEIKDEIEIIGNIYDNPELFKQ